MTVKLTTKRSKVEQLIVFATFLLIVSFGVLSIHVAFNSSAQSNLEGTLVKTTSGLIASDPLNQVQSQSQLQSNAYWTFGGDAPEEGALFNFYEDTGGLHIGVQAPSAGTYAGYYAVSPNTNFVLAHSTVTAPEQSLPVPNQFYESGMYVQTADGEINYVTCTSVTSSSGTVWAVESATGNANQATQFNELYVSGTGLPLTESCTIITNGSNYLAVYLDGSLVYSSTSLNLDIPPPFQVYLEPESSYNGSELYGTFQDYYITSGETVTVNGLPSDAATVELVDPSTGNVFVSAPVSSGTASIEVGNFDFPLSALIEVTNSNGNVIAENQGSSVEVYGGDVYTYQPLSSTTTSTSSSSSSSSTIYTVQPGDYLAKIGQEFNVPWQSIATANNIAPPYIIYVGEQLVIPSSGTLYTVQAGDYLWLIGQKFNVPWQEIATANNISPPYNIYVGEQLIIPTSSSSSGGTTYTVKAGDYLFEIGQMFNVPWQEIASANDIQPPYVIYVGEVLTIP